MKIQAHQKTKQARKLVDIGQCKKAEKLCLKLLKQQPLSIDLKIILGEAYYFQERYHDAIELFTTVLKHSPHHADTRIFLYACYKATSQIDHRLQLAFQFRDAPLSPIETFSAFLAFQDACLWHEADLLKTTVINDLKLGNIPHRFIAGSFLALNSTPDIDPNDLFQIHRQWAKESETLANKANIPLLQPQPPQHKIKIAYISVDFNKHPVGHLSLPVIQNHDKTKFEIYCYAKLLKDDGMTDEFRKAADHFIDITELSLAQTASKINQDGIHILVDLSGHTSNSPIGVLAFKPAPVQITYLGYPNTTGLSCVDFRISDQHSESDNGTLYTEELLKMPETFLCMRGFPDIQRTEETPAQKNGYITFGSFNHIRKINQHVVKTWAKIMQQSKNSRILIKSTGCDIDTIRTNITNAFKQYNITPDRIQFAPYIIDYKEHAALYNTIDIALDTFPYHGTHTTLEALWMGVPVVTLEGTSHVQRVSSSILKCIGFEATVTHTQGEYIAKAVDLASRPENLTFLRGCIHTLFKHSMIFKPQEVTLQLEEKYLQAWNIKMGSTPVECNNKQSSSVRKLHIGGKQKHPEWEILDANESHLTDHVGNANDLSRFQDNTFDALYSSHVLEHFSYHNEVEKVLKEWFRVIKPGGTIYTSVPNLEILCALFLDKQKLNIQDRFMVMRMIFGGQVDPYDFHKVGYGDDFLAFFLTQAGFENIKTVASFGLFDDTSIMEFAGTSISLNMTATKPGSWIQEPLSTEQPTDSNTHGENPAMHSDARITLATLIAQASETTKITIAEVGARIMDNPNEPQKSPETFYDLPQAQIIAFEPDQKACDHINRLSDAFIAQIRAYPYALSHKTGRQPLYITQHGMCSSLYKPNANLLHHFEGLEVMELKETMEIDVIAMDEFMQTEQVTEFDFIKIDVQGAELNVFKGAEKVLQEVIGICTEVEWVTLYEKQPLFADVDLFLKKHGFQMHHLIGVGARPMKGTRVSGHQQFLWSDAVYFPSLERIQTLSPKKLIKLAMMATIYDAHDLALHALECYDAATGEELATVINNCHNPED